MFSYDNKFFYRNVRAMTNYRKKTFAEIESAGELSPGTIARLEYSEVVPPIGVVLKVAEVLQCPVDLLVHSRLDAFIKDDFLLTDFVKKLVEETQTGAIIWKKTDGVFSANFIDEKDVYVSGAPVNGAWKPICIWFQDTEKVDEVADATTDTKSADAAEPKRYIVFDEKANKEPDIYRIVRNFVKLVMAATERPIEPETLAIMHDFLAEKAETPSDAPSTPPEPFSQSDDKSIVE